MGFEASCDTTIGGRCSKVAVEDSVVTSLPRISVMWGGGEVTGGGGQATWREAARSSLQFSLQSARCKQSTRARRRRRAGRGGGGGVIFPSALSAASRAIQGRFRRGFVRMKISARGIFWDESRPLPRRLEPRRSAKTPRRPPSAICDLKLRIKPQEYKIMSHRQWQSKN